MNWVPASKKVGNLNNPIQEWKFNLST